ncbi:MAG: phytanoyl-CoA dioxygenase family protein, partial [Tepidisphaeraceae bacterium]
MSDPTHPLSERQVSQFKEDGYLIIKSLFDNEEMDLLLKTARSDHNMLDHGVGVQDAAGKQSKLSLWNHPGNDIYGMIARCNRVVGGVEQLLGGEVYHYHTKMMLKEPKVGGAWEWHQDYGYWYNNGCLFPDMGSCLIAVDRATRENGCLQLLKGSHKMGRVEHGRFGQQTGADPERVEHAMKKFEMVYFEADPGDALFFHGNTLHASAPNTSDKSRWSLICCYNAAWNDPFKKHHHPNYTPLTKVPDSAVKAIGAKSFDPNNNSFFEPLED